MEDAITAYREAAKVRPNHAQLLAQLARIQIYSSAMLVKDETIRGPPSKASELQKPAVDLAPDASYTHAIHAFALDWNANPTWSTSAKPKIADPDRAGAVRALQLDNTSTLALAFYAEILVDQQKWTQAEQYIQQALDRDLSQMDVHRVHAYVCRALVNIRRPIEAYDKAIQITPNLTFLYLRAGANYRQLAFRKPDQREQKESHCTKSRWNISQKPRKSTSNWA